MAKPADHGGAPMRVLSSLRVQLGIVLVVLAACAFAILGTMNIVLGSQAEDAERIDLAGRQRMLLLRVANDFRALVEAVESESTLDEPLAALEETVSTFEATVVLLKDGGRGIGVEGMAVVLPAGSEALAKALDAQRAAWAPVSDAIDVVADPAVDIASDAYYDALDGFEAYLPAALGAANAAARTLKAESRQTTRLLERIGLTGAFICLVVTALGFAQVLRISGRIGALTRCLSDYAGGSFDRSVPHVDARGEIGDLARAAAVFRESAAREHGRSEALGMLASGFDRDVRSILDRLMSSARDVASTATDVTTAAEAAHTHTEEVASASDAAMTRTEATAAAAQESSASIAEVEAVITRTGAATDAANADIAAATAAMDGLAGAIDSMRTALEAIGDISEQTNTLALNATIEAARAGEAGRGFAIVASEVKVLAGQTAKTATSVTDELERLRERSREGSTHVSRIAEALAEIVDGSRRSSESIGEQRTATDEIARFIEEAAATSGRISASLRQLRETVGRNETAAGVLRDNAGALEDVGFQLQRVVASFLEGVKAS